VYWREFVGGQRCPVGQIFGECDGVAVERLVAGVEQGKDAKPLAAVT
jgi:hypothetical protein